MQPAAHTSQRFRPKKPVWFVVNAMSQLNVMYHLMPGQDAKAILIVVRCANFAEESHIPGT